MTQDYNSILLDYFTGNLEVEQGTNIPVFNQEEETLNDNLYKNIESYLQANENMTSFSPLGKVYNEQYQNFLIYGYYIDNNNNYYGFIYLIDNNMEEIQMITEFSSGTKLFPITALNQAQDGNFYGLSYDFENTPTSRVLLFNNILSSGLIDGDYKAILRNDYVIPYNYEQTMYRQNRITKSLEEAIYYIIMNDDSGGTTVTKIIKFVINVGSSNEWSVYNTNRLFVTQFTTKVSKNGNDEEFTISGLDNISSNKYYEYTLSGTTLSQTNEITIPFTTSAFSSATFYINGKIYIVAGGIPSEYPYVVLYKVVNTTLKELYSFEYYSYLDNGNTQYVYSYIQMYQINNGVFGIIKYRKQNENVITLFNLDNDNFSSYQVLTTANSPIISIFYDYIDYYFINNYNLVSFYIPYYSSGTNNTKKLTFDYNSINYNGTEYVDTNSLVSQKARLYDENNNMIFARNLYNKTINNNTTVSTVNIPNTLLNNININIQNLIGQTNYELISNNNLITKNIYENVNINFFNTLKMINNNDTNNPIFNINGSIRINDSVSQTIDYSDAKATKLHIIYNDDTDAYRQISEGQITINNGVATYDLVVYSPSNNIKSLEIVSQDENTVYQTISGTFGSNKYYKILQEVTII